MSRAVMLTALPVEYSAVRTHLTDLREETHPQGTVYERGRFLGNGQEWEVGIVEVGAGNAGAAVEAERAIAHFKPNILFFVGIAGGIKDVAIGDVVAATKVYGYESGKIGEQFFTCPELGQSAYALVQRARAEARKGEWLKRLSSSPASQPHVLVAPIAAGEKVVASKASDIFKFIKASYNDAIAVEMEGFGFLSAAFAYPNIKTIVIRGISDLIDGKFEADRAGSQEIASRHASAFAFEILLKSTIEKFESYNTPQVESVIASSNQKLDIQENNEDSSRILDHEAISTQEQFFIDLIGRSNEEREILEHLVDSHSFPAIGIWGMGGIGKTRIAREVALECKRQSLFRVAWITANQIFIKSTGSEYSPAFETALDRVAQMLDRNDLTRLEGEKKKNEIASLLRSNSVLLIFDNMESLHEEQDKTAKDLIFLFSGSRSRLIFTSRIRFADQNYPIYLKKLEGLDIESGISLIRTIAKVKNIEQVKNTNDSILGKVSQKLGGLPLALNLVVSQVNAIDLESAIEGFEDVSFSNNDDDYSRFYKFIFLDSWRLIDIDSKKILSVLAERPEGSGETARYLKFATNLSERDLRNAIQKGWKYAFLEIQASSEESGSKIYSLHALTRNFVRTDILEYPK
jgi:nucleoside phosphorylase